MATFKDNNGKEWRIALDAVNIQECRNELDGFDVAGESTKVFPKLAEDPVLLLNVLWRLCREQAADGVEFKQFVKGFGGDQIEAATDALIAAYLDFSPPSKRNLLAAQMKIDGQLRKGAMEKALAKIEDPTLRDRVMEKVDEQMDKAIDAILTPSSPAANSPDSAESLPKD